MQYRYNPAKHTIERPDGTVAAILTKDVSPSEADLMVDRLNGQSVMEFAERLSESKRLF